MSRKRYVEDEQIPGVPQDGDDVENLEYDENDVELTEDQFDDYPSDLPLDFEDLEY